MELVKPPLFRDNMIAFGRKQTKNKKTYKKLSN